MAAFIIATVRITDTERFAAYSRAIAGMSALYGGEAVVAGPVAEVLEGGASVGERVVVSRFPDAAAARAYISSPAYQKARLERDGAAEVDMRLVIA